MPDSTSSPKNTATLVKRVIGPQMIKIVTTFGRYDLEVLVSFPEGKKAYDENGSTCFSCPLKIETLNDLRKWGFTLDESLNAIQKKNNPNEEPIKSIPLPDLNGKLFPFQEQGVAFIESHKGRALIADEMGLGKTIQALVYLYIHPELRPAVVVCPASLKLNWLKEAELWLPNPKCKVLSGKDSKGPLAAEIIIINYDILSAWTAKLNRLKPQVIILDEAHLIKNKDTQRTKAVFKLTKDKTHVIALTGTPILNRPVEIYNAVHLIDPLALPPQWLFLKHFCDAKYNGRGWDFNGASNTKELHQVLINSVMIRRKKTDVLSELPEKIYSFFPMELDNKNDYRRAEIDFINFIRETKGHLAAEKASNAEVITKIESLKQLAVKGKLNQAIAWIENFLDTDGKLVVFAVHKFVIDELMKVFSEISVKIDGSVSIKDRDRAVLEFQSNEKIRLFIGNIQAAGVGLTLTAASHVAFLEYPWSPSQLDQAADRCHRIGQQNSVIIYYLLAAGTIEEKIAKILDSKRKILDAVIDGQDTDNESLLSELIRAYYS